MRKEINGEHSFQVLKEKFWNELVESNGLNGLNDSAIDHFLELEQPFINDELLLIYNKLPENIIYNAMKWGFSDTVVGDSVYQFVEENLDEFKKILFNK